MWERKEHEIVTRRKNELRKATNDLIKLTKDEIKDILRDINANRSNTTNLNTMTKEVEKVQETIQQVRTIKESSIKEIHSILKILDNHFRNTKKNHKIEIPLKDLDNTKLQTIYEHQVHKEIREGIFGPVLEETLKKFNTIVKQYSKKILKTLQLDSKEEDELTITKLSQYNKRVQIQYIIEQNKITNPEDIKNFKIFWPKITAKDVQEYYQTIKNQKYNLDDRKEQQREKNQKNFKIQTIIKKALWDERETCLERLRNEEELEGQYHTYFPNNEVTIDQFKAYLEKEKEKKEKKALKEEKQQLTPEKINLLNQTFEKISKKDLLKNKDTYSNKLKRQGISKTQFELRLERRKRDDEEVASSCEGKANKLIEQFENTFNQRTKYLKIEDRKTQYNWKITFNDDYKERFKKSIVEHRKKEGDPQGSQWEQTIERDIDDKKQTIGSNEIILQKNGKHYIMSLNDIKLILKITKQGMEVVNILPRKLTIKLKTPNQ